MPMSIIENCKKKGILIGSKLNMYLQEFVLVLDVVAVVCEMPHAGGRLPVNGLVDFVQVQLTLRVTHTLNGVIRYTVDMLFISHTEPKTLRSPFSWF